MKRPPRAADLLSLAAHCDQLLRTTEVADWDGAANGLQVQNRGTVSCIAASVDASLATVQLAIQARADLLLVHHGLFWSKSHPWTGKRYDLMRTLVEGNLSVYSSHLPLDLHPTLGNNVRLAKALGLTRGKPFFREKGAMIGLRFQQTLDREELFKRMNDVLGAAPLMIPTGGRQCRRIGIVTGGAGEELRRAAEEGVDTFITGEGPHWTYALAEELGINVFYGGHYATETFGVRALAQHLSTRFRIPWIFLDHPTGL